MGIEGTTQDQPPPETGGTPTPGAGDGAENAPPPWFSTFLKSYNREQADRRKELERLRSSLDKPTNGEAAPAKTPPQLTVEQLEERLSAADRIAEFGAQVPETLRTELREEHGSDRIAYSFALMTAARAIKAAGGATPNSSRGVMPESTRVRPPDAGPARPDAGMPRSYSEFLALKPEQRKALQQRDPDGFALAIDRLERDRFKR